VSDPTTPDAPPELSEEQAREYAMQLRSAPAEQLVTEVLSSLLNLAQVKLGRRDARLLIDLSAVVLGHARPYLSQELSGQLDQLLGQLRLAQVRAEGAATGAVEPNDLTEVPAPPAAGGATPAGSLAEAGTPAGQPPPAPAGQPPPASRLWVPGRDF
jgi:hypothetical protein